MIKRMLYTSFLSVLCSFLLFCGCSGSDIEERIPDPEEKPSFIQGDVSSVNVPKDIQIKPVGGKASECQPGQDIDRSYDGNKDQSSTSYHSIWNQSAKFPVTLEYFFDDKSDIDYIIYHSRNGNGNFGEFDLYIQKGNESDYKKVGPYDFHMAGGSSPIFFEQPQKGVKKVKFEVKSGLGNFVSCLEMEFFQKNPDHSQEEQLLSVFTDLSCSAVRKEATVKQIDALPAFFASLAKQLRNNQYSDDDRDFRIRDYAPYSVPEVAASALMTKVYTRLDNPTGIYAEAGKEIVVLVGDTYGHHIQMECVSGTDNGGESFMLNSGVNKFKVSKSGMLYLIYFADPSDKPIRIHIPMGCGAVNGFFDLEEHQTDAKYADLLKKASYKYFVVKGKRIMFCFHRQSLLTYVPNQILSAINLWDNIIGWEQELMGIDDVRPSLYNNHIYAISPENGYMWATDYCIGFVNTYLNNILLYDNVMAAKDNAWGPAHEIGHIHQKAINWPSSTESSNNLFSNYILYKLNKYCSRGAELKMLADARFKNGQAWYNMGDPTHQNESTEIHMRMNWQLWNYFHRCGYKKDFFQQLFKLLRENRINENNPGEGQLKFAMMASKAAHQNLTDFFELWGFFVPVDNVKYSQYGNFVYNVTPEMIQSAKEYMAQFPTPDHACQYLEDRKAGDVGLDTTPPDVGHYTQFQKKAAITQAISCTVSGQHVTIENGSEAVAFEVKKDSQLLYFSNMFSFDVPSTISLTGASIYAVQADGARKLLTIK